MNPAVNELNLAIKSDPKLIDAKRRLLLLYFQYRAYAQAIPLAQDLIKSEGEDLESLLILGNSLIYTDEMDEGKKILQKAVNKYPDNPNPKVSLARVLLADNQSEEARKLIEAAAAINPEDIIAQLVLASFYERMELYEPADKTMKKLKIDFPENRISYLAPARFYLRRNRVKDAETLLLEAIDKNIKDHEIYRSLALAQHRQRNFPAALDSFKEAVAISPDDQRSSILLADYYIFLRQIPQAKTTYEKIAEKWPELLPVKSKIAELLLAERDYDQAKKHIEGILEEGPDYAGGICCMGSYR